ncbi:Ig-like domain-containing protein [Roseivirga sp. BDSF3-8]|uniref:Ig-like domain-containing protein n=1 Tax=Roseivirga sp. BDSF3-8 TaxID=3241598 RepID=UPI003531FEBD
MYRNPRLLCFIFILSFLSFPARQATAATDKYRVMWHDDPATSMVIGWNQASGTSPVVYFGKADEGPNYSAYPYSKTPDRSVAYKGMNNHFARLTGLEPNTAYYFVIHDSEGTSRRLWFKTAPGTQEERLSFIAGGDSRNNRTPRINANKLVAKLRPHAVFFGGDMTDSGFDSQWQGWFDDWQHTIGADGRMIPVMAARGNHEGSNSDLVNLFDVPNSSVYYALTFGNGLVRAYTLNTEISTAGDQSTWLAGDLAANPGTVWKMAQYHKPMRPHVSGKAEGNGQYSNWANLFHENKVKLVIECDAHTVKTTWPVRPSTEAGSDEGFIRDDQNGTVYAGEGCWGAPLRNNDDAKTWTRNSGSFNQFKWIFVDQNQMEVRTIKVDNADQVGQVSDANIFLPPANLDIWSPSNGEVVTIRNSSLEAPSVTLTSPANDATFSIDSQVTLTADATDGDGYITEVEFFADGTLIGTDNTAPYSLPYTFSTSGTYTLSARATDNDGLSSLSHSARITVGDVIEQISVRISSGADDVEEAENGTVYTNSSDLELVFDSFESAENQTVGLRFTSVPVPAGATVLNAYLQFTTDEFNSQSCDLTIQGEATDHSEPFTSLNFSVSSRVRTQTALPWQPAGWSVSNESSDAQRSPDLSPIVQEIVNRSGWSGGSAMAFFINGTGTRIAESYDGSASCAPLLVVEYSIGSTSEPNAGPEVSLSSPADGSQVYLGESFTLSADASDADGSVVRVDFYAGNEIIGSATSAPYSLSWSPAMTGNYVLRAVATDNEGATAESVQVQVSVAGKPVTTEYLISSRIGMSDDDAEENDKGDVRTNNSDLELMTDGRGRSNRYVGLRFRDMNIPAGAYIKNAYITFTADGETFGPASLVIQGEANGNSALFGRDKYSISQLPPTSATVTWQTQDWTGVWSEQKTPDLSLIVQEIVNRPDYNSLGSMTFILSGSGGHMAFAYDGSPEHAAKLTVEYSTANLSQTTMMDEPYFPNSIAELTLSSTSLQAYPNPFSRSLTIELGASGAADEGVVTVTDLSGRTIIRSLYSVIDGQHLVLTTDHLKAGRYIVQLKGRSGEVISGTFIRK